MRRECLGANRKRGAIVLKVFGQVSLVGGKLWNFDLVGMGKEHRWLDDGVDISHRDLVHHFQFTDVSCEVRYVGQYRG